MRILRSSAAAAVLLTAACFHQIVQTGRAPGSTVIEKPWTSTFVFGIVPAAEINTAAQCPGGVAVVETQRTFLNGLVGVITIGIYTPVDVKITCASGTAMVPGARAIDVGAEASVAEREAAVDSAIELATRTNQTVVVRY
jgi:hypothetical protein